MIGSRRASRVLATAALTVLAAPFVVSVAPSTLAAGGGETGPLHVVGSLPMPQGAAKDTNRFGTIVGIDAPSRRLFYMYTDTSLVNHLVTYDLRSRIPKQVANGVLGPEGDFPAANSYTTAYDSRRHQLVFITPSVEVAGQSAQVGTGAIAVYDDASHKVVKRWNLGSSAPGFYPFGITYSAADDRLYAVGEFSAQRFVADGTVVGGGKIVGPGSAVVALNPSTGGAEWIRPITDCQQVLYSKGIGSLIARSRAHAALYFTCVSGGSPAGQTYPGQAGLVRMNIDPKGDAAAQASHPQEFFAISGSYYSGGSGSGVAAFDPTTDRFYLQSISFKTPGAWVFDGRLTSWVGFVSSKSDADFFIGINEGLGHLYIGTKRGGKVEPNDGILVADVRQTPVPAGEFQQLLTTALLPTDAQSRRLFVRPVDSAAQYLVVEDVTAVTDGVSDLDYDAQTSGAPDVPASHIFFAADATGFGAESVQVGGTGSPPTAVGPGAPTLPLLPGPRALMSAHVGGIDLRTDGAAAAAQAAQLDAASLQEYENRGQVWPYPGDACLDAGGRKVTKTFRDDGATGPANGGAFTIVCDLAHNTVTADVRMGASGAGGTTVSKSSYHVVATRDRKNGVVNSTEAAADGVAFDVQGGYAVRFGRVETTTRAEAHGRAGTAHATWTRTLEGVRIIDPLGKVLLSLPGCASHVEAKDGRTTTSTDSCQRLADVVNKALPTRFRMEFPVPLVRATAKGAFATVEQSEAQYFQQSVVNSQGVIYRGDSVGLRPAPAVVTEAYNDTTERSRTVTVLAASQSNAIFNAVPAFDFGNGDGGGGGSGGDGGGGGDGTQPGVSGGTGTALGPGGTVRPPTGNVDQPVLGNGGTAAGNPTNLSGYFFMRRGLRDAILLVLLSGLLFAGCGTYWRRRRLVDVLVTVSGKEAL
ncbi:MAG TPA: hypothetical protein VFQ85_13345 [Mycobacteriales bacterium]|jgi:hypothetical protein|nr:hypothetical protein [Mycobacteriales bacterium]